MANIYGPILPLQLDSRNTEALVRAIQTRIYMESNGALNDFTPASPLSAIAEGQAFAQAELLYYLNNLPEAFSLQWLRQLGIQRKLGSKSLVEVSFYKVPGFQRALIIPRGTKVLADGGQVFVTLEEVRISESDSVSAVTCQSEKWGSSYNVASAAINKIERNFAGLDSLTNIEPAAGGTDIESVTQMKQRAFEVLGRRNLTTTTDFENEVRTLVPESNIVKVLTYEERNSLASSLSGNIMICVGDESGRNLSSASLAYLINSMKSRVTIGTNISFIAPEVVPVDVVVEVYYDPLAITTGVDVLSQQIFESFRTYFDPASLPLGSEINYQSVARELYDLDFIQSINTLDIKAMIKNPLNLDGLCAGFSGEEDEAANKCIYNYSSVTNADEQVLFSPSAILTYKLFRAEVALTSINDFSTLTFSYDNLYTP
jgi:uncharacterized phage protein gp47/JayE